ncbi:hypothetical protein [Dysgonomonas massiliensis]|uniref:hypothetical protein n=1 Tax=Dysgonomonas massiliensis TaxID=2040292 RepID=UPI000C77C81B|nr:hypothetical protein [Dysgonomonas massiliensis]
MRIAFTIKAKDCNLLDIKEVHLFNSEDEAENYIPNNGREYEIIEVHLKPISKSHTETQSE